MNYSGIEHSTVDTQKQTEQNRKKIVHNEGKCLFYTNWIEMTEKRVTIAPNENNVYIFQTTAFINYLLNP